MANTHIFRTNELATMLDTRLKFWSINLNKEICPQKYDFFVQSDYGIQVILSEKEIDSQNNFRFLNQFYDRIVKLQALN